MNYRVRYFTPKEFLCPCCRHGTVAALLVVWLDLLRRAWGGPLTLNSGWRCAVHNSEVGGARNSRHRIGCAADIRVPGQDGDQFARLAQRLCDLPGWEYRGFPSFIHIAVPREEAMKVWKIGRAHV